jgi:hypothetical protein
MITGELQRRRGEKLSIAGGRSVNTSIMRYPRSAAIIQLAVFTRAVEYGFVAAGVTVALIAAVQSVHFVLNWISPSG